MDTAFDILDTMHPIAIEMRKPDPPAPPVVEPEPVIEEKEPEPEPEPVLEEKEPEPVPVLEEKVEPVLEEKEPEPVPVLEEKELEPVELEPVIEEAEELEPVIAEELEPVIVEEMIAEELEPVIVELEPEPEEPVPVELEPVIEEPEPVELEPEEPDPFVGVELEPEEPEPVQEVLQQKAPVKKQTEGTTSREEEEEEHLPVAPRRKKKKKRLVPKTKIRFYGDEETRKKQTDIFNQFTKAKAVVPSLELVLPSVPQKVPVVPVVAKPALTPVTKSAEETRIENIFAAVEKHGDESSDSASSNDLRQPISFFSSDDKDLNLTTLEENMRYTDKLLRASHKSMWSE